MRAFASPVELADRLQRPIASVDLSSATRELVAATGRVRNEARQWISQVVDDEIRLDGSSGRILLLPEIPVVSITLVEVDGDLQVDGTDYYWTAESGILFRPRGRAWTPLEPRVVRVIYTHGYAEIPQDVKDVVLDSAARGYLNPRSAAQESISGYAIQHRSYSEYGGAELSPREQRIIAEYAAR